MEHKEQNANGAGRESSKEDWEYAQTCAPADFDDHVEPAPPAGEGWERDPSVGCPTCGGCGFSHDAAGERHL
jgi:hypothetical protein